MLTFPPFRIARPVSILCFIPPSLKLDGLHMSTNTLEKLGGHIGSISPRNGLGLSDIFNHD